jgi:DNA ligase-1
VFALLKDWQGSDPTGWLLSEKLDGWRVLWNGTAFVTREGHTLDAPEWFTAGLPPVALDGELFAGRGGFYGIQGLIRDGWHGLTFQIFDAPGAGKFRARHASLSLLTLPAHAVIVPQVRCKGVEHLIAFADSVVDAGGEGAVIRCPRSKWQSGRSGDVLRWVPQNPALNRR